MVRTLVSLLVFAILATASFASAGGDEATELAVTGSPEIVTSPPLTAYLAQETTPPLHAQKLWILKEFGSSYCIPCKKMKSILTEIARAYRGVLKVEVLEIKEHLDEAKQYSVMVIPTQVLLDPKGTVQWTHIGFIPREGIESILKEKGVKKPGT